MGSFDEYLKGKKFILYMDHKPLKKMGPLHSKNRLQGALLEHDFVIQHKKGTIMPADHLSRISSTNPDIIAAFNPFQVDLLELQKSDYQLQLLNKFILSTMSTWPNHLPKSEVNYLKKLAPKLFQDQHKIMWISFHNYKYSRTALYLPE
jgi:hypothetical protein